MTISQQFSIDYSYDILFTDHLFKDPRCLKLLKENQATSVAVIIDDGVISHWPNLIDSIETLFKDAPKLAAPVFITPGGEAAKNSSTQLFGVIEYMNTAKLDRQSLVIVIGGGAVLDLVGFAASITHRGIPHIRIPTTVLSQNDGGVGTKNGINYQGKKNFLGSFYPPIAVINDQRFLTTLSNRDWRAGIAEAIKVALLKDPEFFDWIYDHVNELNNRNLSIMNQLIQRCAKLHAEHITSGDPFERSSSRPLDFGHWSAHKLEQISDFDINHGEAVAIGLLIDCYYAAEIGELALNEVNRVHKLIKNLGFDEFQPFLMTNSSLNKELITGLDEFREHLGGKLTIPLIKEIGLGFEVHTIDSNLLNTAVMNFQKASHEI